MTFSALSVYADEFLALRRAVAKFDPHHNDQDRRSLRHREKLLRSFITFWHDRGCPWPIRAALVLDWIALGADLQHPYRDQHRFYIVRGFLRQVRTFEPHTEVPENIFRSMCRRRAPHLYSEPDIVRLMNAAWKLRLFDSFRPLTIYTLIGLLASTGLRIGEALALKVEDVKFSATPPHLLIHDSKFGKSRNVVLHPSTAEQLRRYLIARSKALHGEQAEAFFTNRSGKYLRYHSQRMMFRRLLNRAGIRGTPGQRGPSLHSFRHTFAVTRLTLWYRQRRKVQELLPHLAVYLGHLGPENTYWYLSNTPELLQAAGELFELQPAEGGSSR